MADQASMQFKARLARVEELLDYFERRSEAAAQARARELIQVLLELNAAGIARMLEIVEQVEQQVEQVEHVEPASAQGNRLRERLLEDDTVSSLLLLHGLHPLELEERVRRALEKARPYLASHGGNIELLEISQEGVLKVALEGSCDGCPSSRETIASRIEEAVAIAAPEITAIEVAEKASG